MPLRSTKILKAILVTLPFSEMEREALVHKVGGVGATVKRRAKGPRYFANTLQVLYERFCRREYQWLSDHPRFREFVLQRAEELGGPLHLRSNRKSSSPTRSIGSR